MSFMSARFGLAAMWIYQGLVPKLLAPEGEVAILDGAGVPNPAVAVVVVGVAEVLLGLLILLTSRIRWPYLITSLLMVPLAIGVWFAQPSLFGLPFNPFALNVVALASGIVGYLTLPLVPRSSNCLRKPIRSEDVDL
jgi:uncharacterized membrane protein YphA (DoxX/SURF4 family)